MKASLEARSLVVRIAFKRGGRLLSLVKALWFIMIKVYLAHSLSRPLMSCSAKSSSSEILEDERKKMGLEEGLLRFSIG